jgi:radical SAM superfamily enzyme YgiQ (UPF0313 family)
MTRGCPHRCLFCGVCTTYPARFARKETVLDRLLKSDCLGAGKVGLVGGAVGDYPDLKEIVAAIIAGNRQVTLSSLRIERTDFELLEMLAAGGLQTLTVAPETGNESLRLRIGKGASDEALVKLAQEAERAGLATLRLYFLIGLPEPEEADAIVRLILKLRQETPARLKLDLSVSTFIPKPGTPWERQAFAPMKEIEAAKNTLRTNLRGRRGIALQFEATGREREAALLSRGDAQLGRILLEAIRNRRPLEQQLRLSGVDVNHLLDPVGHSIEPSWTIIRRR